MIVGVLSESRRMLPVKTVKNILRFLLVAVFLSMAGTAAADGWYATPPPYPYYYEGPYYKGPYYYVPAQAPIPSDVRVMIAEFEKLKGELHYYSLSPYPPDQAKAAQVSARMALLSRRIEEWRWGWRYY
jgi:hypothetical protein